jgi:predicted amidohydrolase
VKIGVLQLNSTVGEYEANRKKLDAAYEAAVQRGADFVIAPKLFLCGYPPRDLLLRPNLVEVNLPRAPSCSRWTRLVRTK